MTTKYDTEQHAINTGAFYAGYSTIKEIEGVLKNAEIKEEQIANILYSTLPKEVQEELSGLVKKIKVFTFNNVDGKKFSMGVSKLEEGYALWLIDPETEMSMRM